MASNVMKWTFAREEERKNSKDIVGIEDGKELVFFSYFSLVFFYVFAQLRASGSIME